MGSFALCGVLLVFSVIFYFISTILQKVCNDLAPPDYVLFSSVIDNKTLWDGSTLIGRILRGQLGSSVDLSLTHILT